jgi:hypothetical protein
VTVTNSEGDTTTITTTKVKTDRSGKPFLEKDISGSADGDRDARASGSADGGLVRAARESMRMEHTRHVASMEESGGFPDASSAEYEYSYSPYSPSPSPLSPSESPGPSQWPETELSRSPSQDASGDVKSEESSGRHTPAAKAAKKEDDRGYLAESYYSRVVQLSEQMASMISRQDDSDQALRAANEKNEKLQRDLQKLSKNVNKRLLLGLWPRLLLGLRPRLCLA